MKKINQTVILLAVSDQRINAMSQYPNVHLDCGYPIFERWGSALDEVFSMVIKYDLRQNYLEKGSKRSQIEIMNLVKQYRPKYMICPIDSDFELSEAVLQQTGKLGGQRVGVFFDDMTMFEIYPKYWLTYLDYVITVDSFTSLKHYQALGVEAIFEPCCADAKIYRQKRLPIKYDVSFVGACHGLRKQWLEQLKNEGIRVNVYGSGWPGKGYLTTGEMVDVFNRSKINLNFADDVGHLKARIFEVCLSGGFLLTQYTDGLKKLFRLNKEVASFDSLKEAAKKIKYYLHHEKERRVIAKAGYLKAQKNYTLEAMFLRIFKAIESGKLKKVKINRELMDKTRLKKRSLRLSYQHAALAIARYLETGRPELWQEEITLAKKYLCRNMMVGLFYFYRIFPKPLAKLISQRVNQWFKLLRRVRWLQNLIVKNIY